MIAIVDYGVGNLFSLSSSLRALGLSPEVTADADRLRAAERVPPDPYRRRELVAGVPGEGVSGVRGAASGPGGTEYLR